MGTQHYSRKANQEHKGSHRSGGAFQDEDRDSRHKSKFGSSNGNRRHRSRDNPQDPSKSPASNFGDDEIGGTSFDPGPVYSEETWRDERSARKGGNTPRLDDKK